MNEKDRKKILIGSIILVITLILAVVGTTYAYFNMQVSNNNKPTNIEITTGEQNKITLSSSLTNYHLHLKVSDMTLDKVGSSYYGTTDSGKDYELTEELGTKELGNISVSGELKDKYTCSAKININKSGNMSTLLEEGDLILVIKEGNRENRYDLSKAITNPNFKFNISSSNIEAIKAYLKFTNQNKDQSNIAGKELTISININDFNCEVDTSKPLLELLREKDVNSTLSVEEVGGMHRYQGVGKESAVDDTNKLVKNNYICFGTTENCGINDKLLDKYMYRIIGITSNNELKLIKESFLKENEQILMPRVNNYDKLSLPYDGINGPCDGEKCDWPNTLLFKRLNGLSNGNVSGNTGDTNIFIDSEEYEYMTQGNDWYNLIEKHNWMYGYTNADMNSSNTYNGDYMYAIETGTAPTKRYWRELEGTDNKELPYKWDNNSIEAKIGLQYINDYLYATFGGSPNNAITAKNAWIFYLNCEHGDFTDPGERIMTGYGLFTGTGSYIGTRYLHSGGVIGASSLTDIKFPVRPVFYLTSNIKLSGEGTKDKPFIIDI